MTRTSPSPSRQGAAAGTGAGLSVRDQLLDAAARLFAESGYAATTTRAIASAVGIKQASVYYHFANKEEILAELLASTVTPALAFSRQISRSQTPAHVQLYALSYFDASVLADSSVNIGALYHLPEVRSERFAEFRQDRERLRNAYGQRITRGKKEGVFRLSSPRALVTELVFAFTESVISIRSREQSVPTPVAPTIAGGCLRLLSCSDDEIAHAEVAARPLLASAFRAADREGDIAGRRAGAVTR